MGNKSRFIKVVTNLVRFTYVNISEPRAVNPGDEEKYSLTLLIPKSDKENLQRINEGINTAISEGQSVLGTYQKDELKLPLRDGDLERGEFEEFQDHYFLNATSKIKPGIVDKKLKEITEFSEIYSGMYGRASLNLYAFNQSGNIGIGVGLLNVQKIRDGEHLHYRPKAQDDFDLIEDLDDEDIMEILG